MSAASLPGRLTLATHPAGSVPGSLYRVSTAISTYPGSPSTSIQGTKILQTDISYVGWPRYPGRPTLRSSAPTDIRSASSPVTDIAATNGIGYDGPLHQLLTTLYRSWDAASSDRHRHPRGTRARYHLPQRIRVKDAETRQRTGRLCSTWLQSTHAA